MEGLFPMPRYSFSQELKAFVKQCSCCKETFVGVKGVVESLKIFEQHFGVENQAYRSADGLRHWCRVCNTRSRRELGVDRVRITQMFAAQEGKCAICKNEISITKHAGHKVRAHTDHDDVTGEVRDLLCGNCNNGLGMFNHNPEVLNRARDYLHKHMKVISIGRRA